MKFERKELFDTLSLLKPAVIAKTTDERQKRVYFDGKYACAFNGEMGIRLPLKCEIEGGLDLDMVLAVLGGSTQESVTLEPGEKDGGMVITLGRAKVKAALAALDNVFWPYESGKLPPDKLEMTKEFLKGLEQALVVKVEKRVNVAHWGVTVVQTGKKKASLFATDNTVILEARVKADLPQEQMLLPRDFAAQIVEHCEPGDCLYVTKDMMRAKAEKIDLFSNVLDLAKLPNFGEAVARHTAELKGKATIPETFGEALERCGAVAGAAEEVPFALTVDKDTLKLRGRYDRGEVTETFGIMHPAVSLMLDVKTVTPALAFTKEMSLSAKVAAFHDTNLLYLVGTRD